MGVSARLGASYVDQGKLRSRLNPGVAAEREPGVGFEGRRVETVVQKHIRKTLWSSDEVADLRRDVVCRWLLLGTGMLQALG